MIIRWTLLLLVAPLLSPLGSHAEERLTSRRFVVAQRKTARLFDSLAVTVRPPASAYFAPTVAQVDDVERAIALAFATRPGIASYDRRRDVAGYAVAYAGYTVNGRQKIFALAMDTRLWPQGPSITLDDLLNKIVFDGGCAVLHLRYDVTDGKMDVFSCNGAA